MTLSSPNITDNVAENLKAVLARIESVRRASVNPAIEVKLVAVGKGHGPERLIPALEAGHRIFGENRVQEAKTKWPALKVRFPETSLHLIGPLQTNKAREAVELFDAIHSLDRLKLAQILKTELARKGKPLELFIQVNTGAEPQKAGITPRETRGFVEHCRGVLDLPVVGLMCIPPVDEEPALHFALLAKLARECGLSFLSMGMSADYETAIRFGATHVRIGTAIFGERE